jgi:hypothetical protein
MTRLFHLAKKITRTNKILFDGNVIANGAVALTGTKPSISFRCRVTVSAVTGHTDMTGSLAVGADSLVFVQAGAKTTDTLLSALPVVVNNGLNCHVLIEAIDEDGNDISVDMENDLPCRIWQKQRYIKTVDQEIVSIRETLLWAEDDTILPETLIKFDVNNKTDPTNGDIKPVVSVDLIEGIGGVEHIRVLRF